MPRQPPVLRWALPRQYGSRVGDTPSVNQSRQRILSNATKELPLWALAFSSRRVLTSAVSHRPREDSTLQHAIGLDWEREGSSASAPYEHVVSGWKASQQRLRDGIFQIGSSYMEWNRPPEAPQHPPLIDYFASHRPQITTQTHEEAAAGKVDPTTAAVVTDAGINKVDFIADLDEQILEKAALPFLLQVRDGERDINKLAEILINHLEASIIGGIETNMQRHQARLFVLSHWISRASHALASDKLQVDSVALCLKVTSELYHSMQKHENQGTATKAQGLNGMRKATMHRLFGLFYPFTRASDAALSTAYLSCQSMTFLSKLLRDDGLRPTQLRFLCRRFLLRLEHMATMKTSPCSQEELWHEAAETFRALVRKGVLMLPDLDSDKSSTVSSVDTFFRLLCLALRNGHIKYSWAKTVILDLARASQVIHMERDILALPSGTGSNSSPLTSASRECSLSAASFVSQSTLEDITKVLCLSGRYQLAKEIAFMAPKEQRSVKVLSHLMRKWSSVLPDFDGKGDINPVRAGRRAGSFRTCTISLRLWTEAMSLLDCERRADNPAFVGIFNARMASHARSKAPRLIAADLKALRSVYGIESSVPDMLGLLSPQAQVEMIRAYCRSGELHQGRQWAHKVVSASKARSDTTKAGQSLPLQVMNVLLSAYLKLKGNKKVLTARRRFSVLLCQAGAIKQQRVHLRRTVNRFLRGKRKVTLLYNNSSSGRRLTQLNQALDHLCAFATRHSIVPDGRTARIILVAILRLSPRTIPAETLHHIKLQADFDWDVKGTAKVLEEVKMLLKGETVEPPVLPLSTKEGRSRAEMIDAALERRQYWQDFSKKERASK